MVSSKWHAVLCHFPAADISSVQVGLCNRVRLWLIHCTGCTLVYNVSFPVPLSLQEAPDRIHHLFCPDLDAGHIPGDYFCKLEDDNEFINQVRKLLYYKLTSYESHTNTCISKNISKISPECILLLWRYYMNIADMIILAFFNELQVTIKITYMSCNYYSSYESWNALCSQEKFFDELYQRPYARIAPYVVGVLTGFLMWKSRRQVRMPKVSQAPPRTPPTQKIKFLIHTKLLIPLCFENFRISSVSRVDEFSSCCLAIQGFYKGTCESVLTIESIYSVLRCWDGLLLLVVFRLWYLGPLMRTADTRTPCPLMPSTTLCLSLHGAWV